MSLMIALQSALSGLKVNQSGLRVTSNNIANANTEGFTRKAYSVTSRVIGGVGSGVDFAGITRSVNRTLLNELHKTAALVEQLGAQDGIQQQLQAVFGAPGDNSSVSAKIAALSNAFEALAAHPEGDQERFDVVTQALAVVRELNDVAKSVQNLRLQAEQGIAAAVTVINQQATTIADLNIKIARGIALGEDVAGLEDQRDLAIGRIAENMAITTFSRSTGEIAVYTNDGLPLVDSFANKITFTPAPVITAGVTFGGGGFSSISLVGQDLTTRITTGKIAGLVTMRDTKLPAMTAELDQLASVLRTKVNTVHNSGASLPPPQTLTGTLALTGGGAFSLGGSTGTVRIAVLNSDGTAAATPFDLDISTTADVNAVVAAINAYVPFSGLVSASVNSSNQLVITAASSADGIAINENTSNVNAGGKGFSDFFGLNDFFTGDATVSLSRTIAVRTDIAANPALVARGRVTTATLAAGGVGLTVGDASAAQAISAVFAADQSFTSAGSLPASTASLSDYAATIVSARAAEAGSTSNQLADRLSLFESLRLKMTETSGVNTDQELANLVVLENAYAASARVMSVVADMLDELIAVAR